ncbi:MAG: FAD-dependent oxidoreductase [Minwuia thermotolerans]|nr:MAG: FAD-dependent oxidoreductase [Minwuia thermotolerans]
MTRSSDIAIIGGGVIGSAIAWWLKAHFAFPGSVTVIEPDPTYAEGATGRSLGSLRQQFSMPENILLSRFGLEFVRHIRNHIDLPEDETPDVQFRDGQYLFLATEAGAEALRSNVATQQATGSPVALLSPDDVSERFPWIRVHDIALAAHGLRDEGWLDPHALLQAFRRGARRAGAAFLQDRVTAIRCADNRVSELSLAVGETLAVGQVVNAAGPWAGAIAAMAGIALPVVPRKRTVFHVTTPTPPTDPVLIVDPSGVYVRPEGNGFLTGSSPLPGEPDPDGGSLDPDYDQLEGRCWPALANRSAAFEALRMTGAWGGFYDYNSFDQNAVLGPHAEITNFHFANGFSGHGVQQAPAVGRALAEWLLQGRSVSLDLGLFSHDRIAANRSVVERGII